MTWQSEAVAAAGFAAAFVAILAGAEAWQRLGQPRAGWSRKLSHGLTGLTCLALPYFVEHPLTVLILAIASGAGLWIGQRAGLLRGLSAVSRKSFGSELFGLSVFLAFWIAQGEAWVFQAGVLVLGLGDLVAAWVGTTIGKRKYMSFANHTKSLEGSLACFFSSLLIVFLLAVFGGGLPVVEAVMLAAIAAFAATKLEAVGVWGSDNLTLPAGVCFLLMYGTGQYGPPVALHLQLLWLLAPTIGLLLIGWQTKRVAARYAIVAGLIGLSVCLLLGR